MAYFIGKQIINYSCIVLFIYRLIPFIRRKVQFSVYFLQLHLVANDETCVILLLAVNEGSLLEFFIGRDTKRFVLRFKTCLKICLKVCLK